MSYFLVLYSVARYSKKVVREIVLRDHLLTMRRQSFFFIFLFPPPQHLSYVALLRYHHCTCPNATAGYQTTISKSVHMWLLVWVARL
jgi:hypothetical protein